MATRRDNFALDWIKGELLQTLTGARDALEAYVESERDQTRMRACLTALHQVHGTLVMLELPGITLLADHLERLAQSMLRGRVEDEIAASQSLMQGILELPGHLEEIRGGRPDTPGAVLELVNEVRSHLGEEPLGETGRAASASSGSFERFEQIDGVEKVRKIRAAYQQVLLAILKRENLAGAVTMLGKVAQGLERVCEGTPYALLWQAFGEFVSSLDGAAGPLPTDAVKVLRRIDSEIRNLATEGIDALRRPIPTELVEQLLTASRERGSASPRLVSLESALGEAEATEQRGEGALTVSGRQALASAARALREELTLVKDQLDLSVRAERGAPEDLIGLIAPLKQIGSTLSLLGFESSKTIVADQVELLNQAAEGHALDQQTLFAVASALVQVDENLASVTQGGKGEAERIKDDAHRAVIMEARAGIEQVKQTIVDYVSAKWDAAHLADTGPLLTSVCGALDMIPLPRASRLLAACNAYIGAELIGGGQPSWEQLDCLADAISGVDYYLERLGDDTGFGADDVLDLVEKSLDTLGYVGAKPPADVEVTVAEPIVPESTGAPPDAEVLEPEATERAPLVSQAADVDASRVEREDEAHDESEDREPALAMDDDPGFDLDNVDLTEAAPDAAAPEATPPEEPAGLPAAIERPAERVTRAPTPPARQPAKLSLEDSFESDAEIVEIFVEEVDEVLGTIAEWLPQWESDLSQEEALTEVRRAFHTLKGSGRIVGANIIGELAWSVENMLNRIIDGTVEPTTQFVAVVDEARALVPGLRDAFEAQQTPSLDLLAVVMERADVLASGGTIGDDIETGATAAAEVPEHTATGERAGTVDDVEADIDPLSIFLAEAAAHMEVLEDHVQASGVVLDDACLRALHTLAGSSGMAGVEGIGALARSSYELAQALRHDADRVVTGDDAEFFRDVVHALGRGLEDLAADQEPDDHSQLLADADHLLMRAQANPDLDARNEARDRLLGLEGLSLVMDAPSFLRSWHDGALDLEFSEQLHAALRDVSQVARETERGAIAELADALASAHASLADDVLTDEALTVLDEGHERLLALFDAVAADQSLGSVNDVVDDLTSLPALLAENAADGLPDEMETRARDSGRTAAGRSAEESRAARVAAAESGNVVSFPRGAEAAGVPSDSLDDELGPDDLDGELADVEEISLEDLADELVDRVDAPDSSAQKPPQATGGRPATPKQEPPEAPTVRPAQSRPAAPKPAAPKSTASKPAAPNPAALPAGLLPDDLDEEIVEVFFEEADEILEQLDENVHQWVGEPGNRLFLEHLLRGLHTLKGGARLAGLARLGDATHQLESFLIDVQSSGDDIEGDFFQELAGRFDEITGLISVTKRALAGEAVTWPPEPAASEPELEAADEPEPTAADAVVEPSEPEPVPAPTARAPAPTAARQSRKPATPARAPQTEEATADAREKGDQRGGQEMVRVGSGLLENLVNLAGESSIVRARIEQGMSDFTSALDEMETTIDRLREQLRRLEIETEAQILFRQDRPEGPSYDDFDPLEMDRYSQLQQLSRGLSESASDMLDLKETLLFKARESETLLLQQARINTELQEGLMRTRMVPFSRLLPRLRRIVRQVSGELGKDVEFHAFNAEGELDRNLLERMVPPLEHMLRNAVDHGIESRELRKNYGKPATGRIDLRLSREGGDVVIEISDDGAGIDVESVRAKAVERGLMAPGAKLRDDEICQFVLAPGFSTAKSVTQISGRGVGMDVVHSEVKQLGGSIQIASRQGKGTRFIVRVPFTVSVNRALMVSVGEDAYAIPLNTIEGIVLLTPEELERLYAPDGNTFEYAGIPYRVRYLGHYLGREFRASSLLSSVPVVLVRSGDHAVAVHVDSVQGSREIVVKSLGPQFAGVGGISGATILGDGSVVVILDLLALIRSQSSAGGAGKRALTGASRVRCVMVVDDSVTVRKVTSRLLERQGMDVMVAKDGIEAISLLQERRPDVMLLDIEMPRMDGFEVARQVRHDDRLHDLPIIMISSRTGEKHQEHAAQLGVNSFLGKPFQENELLATIDRLVH